MMDVLITILASVALFVVTNIDDLALLAAFFAMPGISKRAVYIGQLLGIAIIILLSLIAAWLAVLIPAHYVGLSGLLPLGLGIVALFRREDDDEERKGGSVYGALAIALVTLANGGDNLAAYIPFFASLDAAGLVIAVVIFLGMTALWLLIPPWLLSHPLFGARLERWAERLLPWVLIVLGVVILFEAGTVAWLAGR